MTHTINDSLEDVLLDDPQLGWDTIWSLSTNPIDGSNLLDSDFGISYAGDMLGGIEHTDDGPTDEHIACQTMFDVGYLLGWHGIGLASAVLVVIRANDNTFSDDGMDASRCKWLTDGWTHGRRHGEDPDCIYTEEHEWVFRDIVQSVQHYVNLTVTTAPEVTLICALEAVAENLTDNVAEMVLKPPLL